MEFVAGIDLFIPTEATLWHWEPCEALGRTEG